MPETITDELVQEAIAALDTVRREWMRRPGVSAVDVGYRIKGDELREDELALRVHVVRKIPWDELPERDRLNNEDDTQYVGKFPVDVLEVSYEPSSEPTAAPPGGERPVDPRARLTPLAGGMSVGNPRVTAGTLGAIVWDRTEGWPAILSNWHVLAGSAPAGDRCHGAAGGSGAEPFYQAAGGAPQSAATLEPFYQSASAGQPFYQAAAIGEAIYQPGRFDGGTSVDVVGHLSRLRVDRHMDAALARITDTRPYSPLVLGVGVITGIARPRLGMRVVKSGRSSGVTRGRIDGLGLSTTIRWGEEGHYFTDQVHIVPDSPWPKPGQDYTEVSEGGDSGAVWMDEATDEAVGLHFAGDVGGVPENEHALANPMWRVAEALDFAFTPPIRPLERNPAASADGLSLLLEALRSPAGGAGSGGAAFMSLVAAIAGAAATDAPAPRADAALSRTELEALRAVIDAALAGPRD